MTQEELARPTYGYYRQSNKWITVSVVTELEELRYRREGWEPLPQYGRFDMTTVYAANHPLEALFIKGGAKELCLEQIIDSGFHLNPPLVPVCGRLLTKFHRGHEPACLVGAEPVHFPQLDGQHYEGYQCRFCDRPQFPTERAREQHEGVMHKDEKSDIRTGETLAASLLKGLKPESAEPRATDSAKPYVCGLCGVGHASLVEVARCVKAHKAVGSG